MSAILKFDFQKRKQLRFSEVNCLTTQKRPNFACGNYIFPRTRGKKNKQWTHSTPLKVSKCGHSKTAASVWPKTNKRTNQYPDCLC